MTTTTKLHNDVSLSAASERAVTSAVSSAEKSGKGWGAAGDALWADGIRAVHLETAKNGGIEKLREKVKALITKGLDKVYQDAMGLPSEAMPPKDSTAPADVKLRADRKEGQQRQGRYLAHIRAMLHKREFPPVKGAKVTRTLEARIFEVCGDLIDAIQKSDAPQFDADKVLQNLRAVRTLVS